MKEINIPSTNISDEVPRKLAINTNGTAKEEMVCPVCGAKGT